MCSTTVVFSSHPILYPYYKDGYMLRYLSLQLVLVNAPRLLLTGKQGYDHYKLQVLVISAFHLPKQ